ncbi:DUF4132 domain-containing protein [Marinitenerispora sediminis]|uniref:DUF4132 domain-containing protein n=1 Tax=Marinitenerispora sediminis TaxID=1931232 RepID=A0A368TCW0_9ACTN|nr:DUF4132 domain-containing protein [Marinitenerispora sediminis]RCV49924.1 hypothetical protein DEF28_19490 [Marinitenerispora sediminis]RCV53949.1 hypothetical protein DEF23_16715 [Marinitenerispora sediminis]RCV61434.1 hypothetical protein DEF24_04350 [Marinitenerispora sediminis]
MSSQPPSTVELAWVDGPDGYSLGLDGTTLVCRNPKGRQLKSVPKKVRESAEAEQLADLVRWLERHQQECRRQVESWLLGSLPVPAATVAAVWPDPTWRDLLADLFVAPVSASGEPDTNTGGFLRGVDEQGRLGVLDLDAESVWLSAERVVVAHPVRIPDLEDVRDFAAELGIEQRVPQLTREVYRRAGDLSPGATRVTAYAGGRFGELRDAVSRARRLGFAVRGGYAVCRTVDAGRYVQARYWLGSDSPDAPTSTGDLLWVDADERPLPVGEVGPVAWSEGVRMAETIHAGAAGSGDSEENA